MFYSKVLKAVVKYYRWVLFGLLPLLTSCGVYLTLPGKAVWFAYPPDSALVPPRFSVVVGGVQTSAGWGSEAFGGDVGQTSRAYRMAAIPLEVFVDGKSVATLAEQPIHRLTLALSPGTHQLTVRSAEGNGALADHIQVIVAETFPLRWRPYENFRTVQDTLWNHQPAQRVVLPRGELLVWSKDQALYVVYRQGGHTVWHDSLSGYIYSGIIPMARGVYLPVMPFQPRLEIYWANPQGVTRLTTVAAENLWFEPRVCAKGFAFAVFSGRTSRIFLFQEDGTFSVEDSPPAPANALVVPGAFCADSLVLPQWTFLYECETSPNRVEIHTPRAQFILPPHLITVEGTYQLLAIGPFWLLDNGRGIYGYWKDRWRPIYLPLETPLTLGSNDCVPPKIGVGLLGVLPVPIVNWKLQCDFPLRFTVQNDHLVGPFGKRFRLSTTNDR